MTRRAWGLLVALFGCLGLVAGCGGGGESAGKRVNWYVFDEPSGAFDAAVKRCNKEAEHADRHPFTIRRELNCQYRTVPPDGRYAGMYTQSSGIATPCSAWTRSA